VVKCTDCKTLLKTEIQGLMPRFDDPFGILIREMIDRFRKDKHKMKQIEAAMADFLAHRVCAGMDGFFEEMRGWLQNN
jgi:hypothetical protein